MTTATPKITQDLDVPRYIRHAEFDEPGASKRLGYSELLAQQVDYDSKHMPDEVTREHAKRMHYAAFRAATGRAYTERKRWLAAYYELRSRIVLGNRKLVYRAVRKQMSTQNQTDDTIGDCHIVLIQAVAAFNPWLSVRFSTYAYTCLIRSISRKARRRATDWLSRSLSFESLPDGEPRGRVSADSGASTDALWLDEFFRDDHPLLSQREKMVITQRFSLREGTEVATLEQVGRVVGLSKERVRQVQADALQKLRSVLSPATR